jgi:hypothetical protein
MNLLRNRIVATLVFFSLATKLLYAGGYLVVTNTGIPYKWDPSIPVPFSPDQGTLGLLSNTEAVGLVLDNFNLWSTSNIPTSSLSFANAGLLPVDVVTVTEFNSLTGNSDGISPIIFDTDGTLFEALGFPSGVLGFAGPEFITTSEPFYITEGFSALNGAWIDGNTSDGREITRDEFARVLAHEFGHFLNLDHTQVNGHYFIGDRDDPGFVTYGPPPTTSINIMFPFVLGINEPTAPQTDDIRTISALYPSGDFSNNFGTIKGSVFSDDGTTLVQGVNVIVRNPSNPFLDASSKVSGALFFPGFQAPPGGSPDPALTGAYSLSGLNPGSAYTVEIVNVNSRFANGSSVGPVDPPLALTGPEEFYNGTDESSDPSIDNPLNSTQVTALTGGGTTGIDFIINTRGGGGDLNPPQNLRSSVSGNSVTLNWDPPSFESGGPVLQSYNIYRSTVTNAKTTGELIGNVDLNTTSFIDDISTTTALKMKKLLNYESAQQSFFYQVTAVYDQGESDPSNEVSVQVGGQGATIKPEVSENQPTGAEFWVDISVNSVQDLFGLSFDLDYSNTVYVDVVPPFNANVIPGSFLGNDVLFFSTVDDLNGKVSVGITRKTGQGGVNGNGVVVRIKIVSLASTPSETTVLLSLSNLVANDPVGNPITLTPLSTTVTLGGLIVWPGDTNNDQIVNQADILPIGLFWGNTGPARANASTSWVGQPASPWVTEASTYVDANGNGIIDQADVLPIGLNWNRTHGSANFITDRTKNAYKNSNTTTAILKVMYFGDINPGKEFFVEIHVAAVTKLFGISFELLYPSTLVEPPFAAPGDWMGDDIIFFPNIDQSSGKISIGVTRKAGEEGLDGSGVVARIRMILLERTSFKEQVVDLSLQNVVALDQSGKVIPFEVSNNSIKISDNSPSSNNAPNKFLLYGNTPNPFNPTTKIRYDLSKRSDVILEIFDILGRHVRTLVNENQQVGRYSAVWDGRDEQGRHVSSGIYIYQIRAGQFVQSRKMAFIK